jgi:hypothetical protein
MNGIRRKRLFLHFALANSANVPKDTYEESSMPAKSEKQRRAMAIAEHHPEKLYSRNKSLKSMSKSQLHDFASTKEKKLPKKVKKSK